MNFFRGHFLSFYAMSEIAGFKNIYMSLYKKKYKIAKVPLTARGEGGGLRAMGYPKTILLGHLVRITYPQSTIHI